MCVSMICWSLAYFCPNRVITRIKHVVNEFKCKKSQDKWNSIGGFKYFNICIFTPVRGKVSSLTSIFQMGWNHQPELVYDLVWCASLQLIVVGKVSQVKIYTWHFWTWCIRSLGLAPNRLGRRNMFFSTRRLPMSWNFQCNLRLKGFDSLYIIYM